MRATRRATRAIRRVLLGGAAPGPARVLAAVLVTTTFLATAAPRLLAESQTRALQQALTAAPVTYRSIGVGDTWTMFPGETPTPSQMAFTTGALGAELRRPLAPEPGSWAGATTALVTVLNPARRAVPAGKDPELELLYRNPMAGHLKVIAGALPARASIARAGHLRLPVLQVAVSAATATRFALHPGSRMHIVAPEGQAAGAILEVTGIVTPVSPSSTFWVSDTLAAAPRLQIPPSPGPTWWIGAVFLGGAEIPVLPRVLGSGVLNLTWQVPLVLGSLTASEVPRFQRALHALPFNGYATNAGPDYPAPPSVLSSPVDLLTAFQGQQTAADQVFSLIITGLFLIGLVLMGLAARLLIVRRADELAAMRARGISLPGLALRVLAGPGPLLLICLGAGVALGIVASTGGNNAASWQMVAVLAIVAFAVPPALAVTLNRRLVQPGHGGRADVTIRRRSSRRVVAEVAAVVLAAGAVLGLRHRGPGHGTGIDLLGGTGPQLVALVAALLVIRCYPLPLRAALRLVSGWRGAAPFLGLARATRAASTSLLPALALILAMALAGFGGMVVTTINQARTTASWQQVGSDASVSVPDVSPVSAAAARQLSQVSGVRHAATASAETGSLTMGGRQVDVTAVSTRPAPYAALSADTPFGSFAPAVLADRSRGQRGAAVPVLVSPAVAQRGAAGLLRTGVDSPLRIRVAGVLAATPAARGRAFIVIPQWAASRDNGPWPVNEVLLTGPDVNGAALRAIVARRVPRGQLQIRADVIRHAVAASPVASTAQRLFALFLGAAVLLAVVAATLGMALSADSRRWLLTTLTVLGLRSTQLRTITLLESLPLLIVSVAGGLLAALALPAAIGPALSLAVFVGPGPPVTVQPGLLPLLAAAAGTALVVLAIALVQSVAAARSGLGQAMREGELR